MISCTKTGAKLAIATIVLVMFGAAGCRQAVPALHPVRGLVTLGGKPFERLLVYLHPQDAAVSQYTLGVGETDANGVLTMRSTAGDGLAEGNYRVTFSCLVTVAGEVVGAADSKNDDGRSVAMLTSSAPTIRELVPEAYVHAETTPVQFQIRRGEENTLEFDIPAR
jgi:hypothetical protein